MTPPRRKIHLKKDVYDEKSIFHFSCASFRVVGRKLRHRAAR
jgi:hypothetical protein